MSKFESSKNVSSATKVNVAVQITAKDLPLSCPMPSMSLWDMHPKVYLAIDQNNQALCPYCGTCYVFIDE